MFRLIKLAVYGLLGYALYEFFCGLTSEQARPKPRYGPAQSGSQRQSQGAAGANMTGGGEGEMAETQNPDGGSTRHAVGRGVVSK